MNKTYLINLHKKHSIIALVATLISLFCYGYSLYGDFVAFAIDGISLHVFRYFTILTGMYGFLTTIMVIPFAVNGLLKKRFTYPRWMSLLHFSSIISTTLVFVFTLFFISWFDPTLAFGSYNFFLHIICPLLIMTSFYMTESPYNYNNIESAICMAPFAIYSVVYLINVVFRKTWDDIYNFNTFLPFYISMPLMYLLATLSCSS